MVSPTACRKGGPTGISFDWASDDCEEWRSHFASPALQRGLPLPDLFPPLWPKPPRPQGPNPHPKSGKNWWGEAPLGGWGGLGGGWNANGFKLWNQLCPGVRGVVMRSISWSLWRPFVSQVRQRSKSGQTTHLNRIPKMDLLQPSQTTPVWAGPGWSELLRLSPATTKITKCFQNYIIVLVFWWKISSDSEVGITQPIGLQKFNAVTRWVDKNFSNKMLTCHVRSKFSRKRLSRQKKKTNTARSTEKFQWAMINFCKLVQNIIISVLTTECFILFQSPVHFDKHAKHISADASQGFDQLFVARECDHLIICVCLRRNKCSHFDKTLGVFIFLLP